MPIWKKKNNKKTSYFWEFKENTQQNRKRQIRVMWPPHQVNETENSPMPMRYRSSYVGP